MRVKPMINIRMNPDFMRLEIFQMYDLLKKCIQKLENEIKFILGVPGVVV